MKTTAKIERLDSTTWETRKVLFMLSQIHKCFYQTKGFLLLKSTDDLNENVAGNTIITEPQLFDYLQHKFNWNKFDSNVWSSDQWNKDTDKYKELYSVLDPEAQKIEINEDLMKEAIDKIMWLFEINELEIKLGFTRNGSIGIFHMEDDKTIYLAPRTDFTYSGLVSSIVGAIIRKRFPKMEWEQYQLIQQFIIKDTVIGKQFANNNENNFVAFNNDDLYRESLHNYLLLGFPVEEVFSLKAGKLSMNGYGIVDFLTLKEERILTKLCEEKPNVVTLEVLGDILWEKAEDYSLQAITKTIERIRKKLTMYGLQKEVIFTKKNQGYSMVD